MGWKDDPVEGSTAAPAWAADPVLVHAGTDKPFSFADGDPAHATVEDLAPARQDVADTLKAGLRGAQKVLSLGHRVGGAAAGMGALYSGKEFTPAYDAYRKEAAQQDEAARAEHPAASVVGQVAPALLVPGAGYSTLAGALGTGAAVGGAQAVADTPDLTAPGAARGVAKGAMIGAALGSLGYAAPGAAGGISDALEGQAVKSGRRVLTGGGTPMNATKEPLTAEAVTAALDHGAIVPGGTTAGTAKRLHETRTALGDQYERIIDALRAKGIEGPNADALAQQIIAEGKSISASSMTEAVPDLYAQKGALLQTKPTLASGNLDLKQAESMKRSLQHEAKYGRYEDTPINEAKQEIASDFRKANEAAIDSGAAASNDPATQAIAAQFRPVKEDLGNIIAASRSADRGAGKAAMSRGVSLTDYAAAAAGYATGGATGAGKLGIINHVLRTRGPSTVAWGTHQLAEKVAAIAKVNPASLGKYGGVLASAVEAGGDALAANLYVIGQTDPTESDNLRKALETP